MRHRILALGSLLLLAVVFAGCDAGPKKVSNEPVVQDLEIETGEAFNPSEKKDK